MARLHQGQMEQRHRIVISGNPVVSLNPAAGALVQNHLLAIWLKERANGGHDRATIALAIAWVRSIDVTGMQALRTVIAMLASRYRGANKRTAFPAFELFRSVRLAGSPGSVSRPWLALILLANPVCTLVVVRPAAVVHLRHVGFFLKVRVGAFERLKRGSTGKTQGPCRLLF
jgi:hypothetical protein